MDVLGKYLQERAQTQLSAAQRIAAQQAALNAQLKARQGAANVGGPPVPAYAPPPRAVAPVSNVGGALGGVVRNVAAAAAAPYTPAPPPPPSIGQRIASQIVERAGQVQQTAQIAAPSLPPPPAIPMGMSYLQQPEEEAWQVWESPEGNRVAMPTTYTPPETWTTMGDPFSDAARIENARNSPLAYDNQPPEIQAQIQTPVNTRGIDIGLDQQRMADTGPVTRTRSEQQGQLGQGYGQMQEQMANRVLSEVTAPRETPDPSGVQPGPEISSAPYIRVRSGATGEVYTVPKERARNLGPNDQVVGTATYQPQESQDRDPATPAEAYEAFKKFDRWTADTFNNTLGAIFPSIMDYVGQPGGLPRILGDIWQGMDAVGVDDAAGWVWNTPILGSDTTLGDLARGIWDLDIEGVSVGDVVQKVFEVAVAPGDDVMTATSDHLYEELSGKQAPDTDNASIGVVGDVLTSGPVGAAGAFLARPYASWARENPEQFIAIYEGGFDSDGDGTEDIFGADAVLTYWTYTEANLGEAILVQVVTDPFSIVPVIGQGAGRLRNVLRAARATATTERGSRALRAGEAVATGTQRSMRVLDEAGSMGLGVVLDHVLMPLGRGLGTVTTLGRESRAGMRATVPGEAGGVAVGVARRADDNAPLDIPVTRLEPETAAPRAVDARPPDGGTATGSSIRVSQPTPNLDRGPDLRTPDGATIPTRVADGQGGTVTREVTDTGVVATERNGQPTRTQPLQRNGLTVDVDGIEGKYFTPIARSMEVNGPGITQVAIDTMRASGRFIDQSNITRAIQDTLSLGNTSSVDNLLATSEFAAMWNDALRDAGGAPIGYIFSDQATPTFNWAQRVVHMPWSTTGGRNGARSLLYQTDITNPNAVRSTLPANPTPQQMAAAERYADLVDSHLFWNPQAVDDPNFARAVRQATEIRRQLADLEYEGRPTGSVRRGSLLGGGERPDIATSGVSDPSIFRRNGDGGFANASQVRKVVLPGEHEFGEIAGYPVINERQVGANGDLVQEVRLDEDTVVVAKPLRGRDVPRSVRKQYPDMQEPVWAHADLVDASVQAGDVVRIAPTTTEAVQQVADEAAARGLINPEAPVDVVPATVGEAPVPRTMDDAPLRALEPVDVTEAPARVNTSSRMAQRGEDVRAVWGDIDPESVSPAIRKAIDEQWIADGTAAQAFQNSVVGPRNWTDADAELILRTLNDIRVANGSVGPITVKDVPDILATPAGKEFIASAERLARVYDAIEVQESILRSVEPSAAAKTQARSRVQQLQADATKIRKNLGWKKPSRATPPANVEMVSTRDARAVVDGLPTQGTPSRAERLFRITDKTQARYVENLRKLTTLEYGPAPVRSLTMDEHGLVRFHGAVLTNDEIAELTRLTFEALDGSTETFLDRWNRYLTETRASVKTTLSEADDITTSLTMTMRDYEALVDVLYQDGKVAQFINKALAPVRTYTTFLREKILGSWLSAPRYVGTQIGGNPMLMALGGYGDLGTLKTMTTGIRRSHQETLRMHTLVGGDVFDSSLPILHADRIAHTWGTSRAPEVRRHVSSGTDLSRGHGVVEGFFRRHNLPAARAAAAVFGDTRVIRFAGAVDMAARDAVYATAFHRQIRNAITDFRLRSTDILMETGMTRAQAVEALTTFRRTHPEGFTSNDVRDFFRMYVPDGKAERLARDWQGSVNRTADHARKEVSRVLFAGKETRLDAALKPFVMFSYFSSRQYYFLIRQALHHPILLSTYAAYQDYMRGWYEKNREKVPEWLQGYFQVALYGPLAGYALFINPISLLQVGNLFNTVEIDFGDPKGMVEEFVDGIEQYAFLSPLITDTLNVLGYLGKGRNVDPLRLLREVETVRLVKNWLVTSGIGDDAWFGSPIIDMGNQLRSLLSGALPGSEEVEFVDSANRELRELHAAIEQEARAEGITDPAEVDAILSDPTHPLYKAGLRRYVWGEAASLAVRLTPLLASHRPQVRPVNQLGQDLFTNTTANQRLLINATDESRSMRVQKEAYKRIGDSRVATVADRIYNDVVYSDTPFFDVTVDGITYTHDDIAKMDDETRMDLGKAWLAEYGLINVWQRTKDEQKRFLSQPENAEYATFRRWQSEVFDYPGGPEAYWEQAAQGNENAKQYLDNLNTYLTPDQREHALTSDYAYMAVAGIPVGWSRSPESGEYYASSDYRSPAPRPTHGYDPVNIANRPPEPTPFEPYESEYNEDLRKNLDNYQRYRARDEEVLQQIYTDWNMSPDTRLATVDYDTSKAIKKEFTRRTGGRWITEPDYAVEQYFLWREANGGGTLDQYIEWKDQEYLRNLPQNFTEEQNRPAEGQERDDDAYDLWNKTTYRGD